MNEDWFHWCACMGIPLAMFYLSRMEWPPVRTLKAQWMPQPPGRPPTVGTPSAHPHDSLARRTVETVPVWDQASQRLFSCGTPTGLAFTV